MQPQFGQRRSDVSVNAILPSYAWHRKKSRGGGVLHANAAALMRHPPLEALFARMLEAQTNAVSVRLRAIEAYTHARQLREESRRLRLTAVVVLDAPADHVDQGRVSLRERVRSR